MPTETVDAEVDTRPGRPIEAVRPPRVPPPRVPSRVPASRPPDNGPGGLVLLWLLWLLGNWATTLSVESTVPAVRWVILAAGLGAMLLWPAFRLASALGPPAPDATLDERVRPASAVLFDWLCLMLIMQILVWPLRLTLTWSQVAPWSQEQTAWVLAALASWSLLTGAIVAVGARSRKSSVRMMAMAACALLFLGEPAVMALANAHAMPAAGSTWRMVVSPIQAFWEMTDSPANWAPKVWRPQVVSVAIVAVAAWALVGLTGLLGRRRAG
ncbi:MAG: hypothetical protein NTW19_03260 [Planctomycetota bacterium]|nr:hypothetical protein [Planctomycetota bacterium]